LRRAPSTLPDQLRLVYLRLPDDMNPQIRELAQRLTAANNNNYDRAVAIQNYLRTNFTYSLDPPPIDPNDPVGSFLFSAKAGHCEYFASAMALMVRTIGIPSRVVNGFQTGAYNKISGDYVIRARDAHSWVEIFFTGYGWVSFDPTPPDPNNIAGEWSAWDDYLDSAALFWNEWVINYDFGHQMELAQQMEDSSRQFQQDFQRRIRHWERQGIALAFLLEAWLMTHKLVLFLMMVLIFAALLLEGKTVSVAELRFLWAWRFHRGELSMSPREAALTYRRFLEVVRKRGYKKAPSQTPAEFALSFAGSGLAAGVEEFTRLYNSFRFGQAAVSLVRLRRILEDLRRA